MREIRLSGSMRGMWKRGERHGCLGTAERSERSSSIQGYRNNPVAQYEGYYASIFYSHIAALGLDISVEDATHQGRVDMSLRFNGQVWLFEFKVVELSPEGKALAQLKAKNYAEKYKNRGEPIHLIGIEFSKEMRSVVGFEVETWLP
jgi:hypothetical protein